MSATVPFCVLIERKRKKKAELKPDGSASSKRRRRSSPSKSNNTASGSESSVAPSRSLSIEGDRTGYQSAPVSTANGVPSIASTFSAADTYIVPDDELLECDDLSELLGESQPKLKDRDDTLPVRVLNYFTIYDYETNERKVLPLDIDPEEDVVFYGASGCVRPQLLDEDGDDQSPDDDEDIRIKLTRVLEVWTRKEEFWIRTEYAWYILEYPDQQYYKFFRKTKSLAKSHKPRQPERRSRTRESSGQSLLGGKEPSGKSFLTPIVGKIAKGLFLRSLMMSDEHVPGSQLQNICVPDIPFIIHNTNPNEITWGDKIPGTNGFYKSVFVDGVEYHVNDTVAVAAPDYASDGELSERTWFAMVCYFFDHRDSRLGKRSKSEKYFHLRWFRHGSQTILGETANPQALFLLDECDDNPVESILQKITVHHLGPGEEEPVVISDKDVGSSIFHLIYKWHHDTMTMSTVDFEAEKDLTSQVGRRLSEQPDYKRCYSCAVREHEEMMQMPNKLGAKVLEIYGVQYHLHDFVYVRKNRNTLLRVGQIVDLLLGEETILVSLFDRVRPPEDERCPRTERSLVFSGREKEVPADALDGHCFVKRSRDIDDEDAWLDEPDTFVLLHSKKTLKQCPECEVAQKKRYATRKELLKQGPLRAMDLFAGAGGLSAGMEMSRYVKTCWAVERDPSAAETLKFNHENTIVYNQDCSALLKHAWELQGGNERSPLLSLGKKKAALPPLPSPGEVDIIMGGPPCQPFSGMNRFKRVDDARQTCIPSLLSFVELLRPKYVLIENVTGILHYRLKGKQEGRRIVGGVESGMVKLIGRLLTALGYQFQMRVLNSADYGAPQQRNRVIFWAARMDISLPQWPIPTYLPRQGHNAVIRQIGNIFFPGKILAPVASRREFEDGFAHAPFHSYTVLEAIDDLPSWDWSNPGVLYPQGKRDSEVGRTTFVADTDWSKESDEGPIEVAGYDYAVLYASPPRNLFQKGLRNGEGDASRATLHYTALFSATVVERTVNIPVKPLANFLNLPRPLRQTKTASGLIVERSSAKDTYWRLDGMGQFRTMMTTVNPASKGAYVIHPRDKRALTIREQARAQGFPDHFEFLSVEEKGNAQTRDMERQIGNAVPVHLAYALGRALGEGLVDEKISRLQDEIAIQDGWDAQTDVSEEL